MRYILVLILILFTAGCGHNQGNVIAGKGFILGAQGIQYFNGFALIDTSRENSSWKISFTDEDALKTEEGTIKGVKSIERTVGKQVTGYLCELSEKNAEAAKEYLKDASKETKDASKETKDASKETSKETKDAK